MWKENRAAALKAANDIVQAAKAQGRQLTTTERETVEAKLAEVDRIDAKVAADAELLKNLGHLGVPGEFRAGYEWDEDSAPAKAALVHAIRTKSSTQVELPRKELANAPALGGGENHFTLPTPGENAAALRDLFQVVKTDNPTVRIHRVGAVTGTDLVEEGAVKPELTTDFSFEDKALVKLAGRMKVTDEFLEDALDLLSHVQRQALLDLSRRENKLILDTLAATSGIVVKTGTAAGILDLLAEAIGTQEGVHGLSPEWLAASPVDLVAMRKLKATGSGEYLLDPFGQEASSPFGLKVMPVPGMTPGQLWMGRSEAVNIYEKGGVIVKAGHSDDDFDRNKFTFVFEERILPAVVIPGLVTKITLT